MPRAGFGREVRAGEERAALGRREDGQRPAEVRGERRGGRHVGGVDLGMLLAVDLDRDEAGVEVGGGRGILERLPRHHVAPVAGRVADRDHDRHVARGAPRRRPPHPTGTMPPGCRRGRAGTGSSPSARRSFMASSWVGQSTSSGCALTRPEPSPGSMRVDRRHLGVGQLEVEDVEVLFQALAAHRLREDDEALLHVPAQHRLSRRLAVVRRPLPRRAARSNRSYLPCPSGPHDSIFTPWAAAQSVISRC